MPTQPPPLPTLLSQTLVAITIEVDNEVVRRTPHHTTRGPAAGAPGPWLTSLAMWSNLLRLVADDGVSAAQLGGAGGNLAGMTRWGWVRAAADTQRTVRVTAAGRRAAQT